MDTPTPTLPPKEDFVAQLTEAMQASNINLDMLLLHLGGKKNKNTNVKAEQPPQGLNKEKASVLKVHCAFVPPPKQEDNIKGCVCRRTATI
jgi:hypothetical protein